MLLDAVLGSAELTWLATERDKLAHFTVLLGTQLRREELPAPDLRSNGQATVTVLPRQAADRARRRGPDARVRVPRHAVSAGRLPGVSAAACRAVQSACRGGRSACSSRRICATSAEAYMDACRQELASPLRPSTLDELRWFFEQQRAGLGSRRPGACTGRRSLSTGTARRSAAIGFARCIAPGCGRAARALDAAASPVLADAFNAGHGSDRAAALAARVPPSLSPGGHVMRGSRKGELTGWSRVGSPRLGRYRARMALRMPACRAPEAGTSSRSKSTPYATDSGRASGRRLLPPPPPLHTPQGGESGRERPPSRRETCVSRAVSGGSLTPRLRARPFGRLWPRACRRACTVHDALRRACVARRASRQCAYAWSRPLATSFWKDPAMSVIKPRTRGKQLVPHRTRLDHETNETLYAYAQFIGEPTEYVLNQVIDTVLAKDKDFHAVARRRIRTRSCRAPRRRGRSPARVARRRARSRRRGQRRVTTRTVGRCRTRSAIAMLRDRARRPRADRARRRRRGGRVRAARVSRSDGTTCSSR